MISDELVSKLINLVSEGSNPDEIKKVMEDGLKRSNNRTRVTDRVDWIRNTSTLSELRRRLKVAHAKKSKSKGYDPGRYLDEIRAGNQRLDELLESAGDNLIKLIDLDEEVPRLLSKWTDMKTRDIDLQFRSIVKPNLEEVHIPFIVPPHLLWEVEELLGKEARELLDKKVLKRDNRILRLSKKINILTYVISKINQQWLEVQE